MITEITGKCKYKGCKEKATHIACGRKVKNGHPKANVYCKVHAELISEEGCPEYTVSCPNCRCMFGDN